MIESIIVFFAGMLLGGFCGWVIAQRSRPASPFEEDDEVADALRSEATASVRKRIETRKDRIVAQATQEGRVTNDDVEDMFCISDRTSGRYLRELVDTGRLVKVGKRGRGVHYTPINK